MSSSDILLALIGLGLGGILKGATGAGAPVIGVPVLAVIFNVPMAVAIFTVPNLLTNLWQGWQFRKHQISRRFTLIFAGAGALGAGIGSLLLAFLPGEVLMGVVAGVVLLYIAFRLMRPNWHLARPLADRLCAPVGLIGGMMQGAGGISAPVSVTFLNAMRLERGQFIATISVFFCAMSLIQIPALIGLGILTPQIAALSGAAMVPLLGGMPIGAWLARRISKESFDKIILALLGVIALKLLFDAVL